MSSRQYLGKLYAVELSDELEVDATLSRYEKLEVEWKRARREIVHFPTLRNSYLRCGGVRDDFGNREKVLARLRGVLPTLLQRGVKCRTCGEHVSQGHLQDDFQKFGRYLDMRREHQKLREKLIIVYFSQTRPLARADG